jgi:hypothetical protein
VVFSVVLVKPQKEIVNRFLVFLAGGLWPPGFFFAIFPLKNSKMIFVL